MSFTAFGIVAIYNLIVFAHIYQESVTTVMHESYLVKKETEYCLGISSNWLTRYFFLFTNYKSGAQRMYFGPMFNMMRVMFPLIVGVTSNASQRIRGMVIVQTIIFILCAVSRPYRSGSTNYILFILNLLFMINFLELELKISGFESDFFADKYFFWLNIFQSTLVWFSIFLLLVFQLITKAQWPVTREFIENFTQGQEMAIIQIQRARKFKDAVLLRRVFDDEHRKELEDIINVLEREFNELRDKNPVILDAMLETMENMKTMQKNYDELPSLYGFDYKASLDTTVLQRRKAYEIAKVHDSDSDKDEEN